MVEKGDQDFFSGAQGASPAYFATTRWSVVLEAGQATAPQASAALEHLCRTYWYPLYAFARRQGFAAHDAQDLTQEFFARLFTSDALRTVAREKGRFRSFLLAVMKNLIANERDRSRAKKRGGGTVVLSIDVAAAEDLFARDTASSLSAEALFDRQWALGILDQSMTDLRAERAASGNGPQFERLKRFLSAPADAAAYDSVAGELGMTPHAVTMAVFRLRQRYRELVRARIADTVATAAEIDGEMNYLIELVS